MEAQKRAYELNGNNLSWNAYGFSSPEATRADPHYFDNPYWMRHNTYNTDRRNRYFGNINLNYEVNDNLSVLGRVAFDQYDEVREERINVGSVDVSEYSFNNRNISEVNYDLIISYNKNLTDDLNLDALVGWNLRINNWDIVSVLYGETSLPT